MILQKGDRIYFESQAIIKLITALPNRTKLLGVGLWLVPKPVRNFGYRMFANNQDGIVKQHGTNQMIMKNRYFR